MIPIGLWLLLSIIGIFLLSIIAFGTGDLDVFDFPIFVFIGSSLFLSGIIGTFSVTSGVFSSLDELLADFIPVLLGCGIAIPISFIYSRFMAGTDPEAVDLQKFAGKTARVVYPVGTGEIGQIRVVDDDSGSKSYYPALAGVELSVPYSKNKAVKIQRFEGRTAIVVAEGDTGALTRHIEPKKSITVLCASCGQPKPIGADTCTNCGYEVKRCIVCKGEITHGQEIQSCPYCMNPAHRPHILEWVKKKGTCPVCKESIRKDDLVSLKKSE
ncbi:MAG: hypothetical protein ACFFD4_24645 [Candidatus Odinarchaeota archaeon]